MKTIKKNVIKLGVTIFLMLIILSNTRIAFSEQPKMKNPDIFIEREGYGNSYTDLDPAFSTSSESIAQLEIICEPLIRYNEANLGTYNNILADSWSISPNGSVYTFHLKQNIKYQDGTPFNAYTMKYSIDREVLINDKYSGISQGFDPHIVGAQVFQNMNDLNITQAIQYLKAGGVVAQDEFTLLIKSNQPSKQKMLPVIESFLAISPSYIIKNLPSEYNTNQSDDIFGMVSLKDMFPNLNDWTKLGLESNHNPAISGIVPQADSNSISINTWTLTHVVGTGAYRLVSSSIDNITLSKNVNWHGTFSPNSPDTAITINDPDSTDRSIHFLQGDSDIWYIYNYDPIFNYIDANGNSIIKGVKSLIIPIPADRKMYFNLHDKLPRVINASPDIGTTWNMSHIINDHLVRYSTNDSLLASIDNPFTALKFREAFSYSFDYNSYIQDLDYNIFGQKSHGLIPKGNFGYQENSIADGTIPGDMNATKAQQLFKEVGWRGNITLVIGANTANNEINTLLKNTINSLKVGINILLENITQENISIDLVDRANWQIGHGEATGDSYSFVNEARTNQFVTSQTNYTSPTIDNLLDKALIEPDSAKLLSYYNQIEQIIAHDYYAIYLYDGNYLLLYHDWVHMTNYSFYQAAYRPQYIEKYQNLTTTTTTTTTTSLSSTSLPKNTPGFEINSLALLVVLILIRKKFNTK